ncbi:MAG: hypothetical protein E7480_05985 [Ruminococcaceae bacterium]|nr:hypothetical protein [Oscillospiraceae bacterium]
MFDFFTVAFFGHRHIDNLIKVEDLLEEKVGKLIREKEYVEFLVGRNGDFDRFASSAVLRARKKYGECNSSLVLVLPYSTAEFSNNKEAFYNYYTDVEIACAGVHPKAAIQARNREMVDRADLIICYVEEKGGASKTIEYAKKKEKTIINLAKLL